MNILITGGAGYVGSVAARVLAAQGHQIRVLDSLMHNGSPLLGLYGEDGFEFLNGDIRSKDTVARAVGGMDAVVHLAAIVGDPACTAQPELAKQVNLEGSLSLVEAAQKAGVSRLVFASTCSNYGRMSDPNQLIDENSDLSPVSLYAETKVAVEKALLSYKGGKPVTTVLRLATVYGVSPRMRFDLTVNEFTQELATKGKLDVYGEQFWRPYVHVRDAARAIALVLASPEDTISGEVFNVGDSNENFTKAQLLDLITAQLNRPVEIKRFHKVEDPRDYRVSFEKIRQQLGFEVTRRVPDGIREVLDLIDKKVITEFTNPQFRN